MEALWLFKDWENLQISDCSYRNHRSSLLDALAKV